MPRIPLYGLQSPRLSRTDALPTTLTELAAEHTDRNHELAPHGPRLLGWSFGGTLADELAVQLWTVSREVSFVGMLDAFAVRDPAASSLAAGVQAAGVVRS